VRTAFGTAYGGFMRPTTTAGAKASSTFNGRRSVGVVMRKASTLGTAQVCVFQGTTNLGCQTIDLSPPGGAGSGPRRLAYVKNALNPANTYRVEVTAVSGRTELDAIVFE
jgi:hypothetical protein